MRRLMPIGLGLACILVVVLALQNRALTKKHNDFLVRAVTPQPGLYVPDAPLRSLDGEQVTIGEPKTGGHQVLFFFNTTCQYCRASIPAWESIAARARSADSRIDVYGVSLDSLDKTREYVQAHNLTYRTVVFPPGKLPALYRTRSVPMTMIIDADGRVAYARVGGLSEQAVVDSVLAAMTAASESGSIERAPDPVPSPPGTTSGAS